MARGTAKSEGGISVVVRSYDILSMSLEDQKTCFKLTDGVVAMSWLILGIMVAPATAEGASEDPPGLEGGTGSEIGDGSTDGTLFRFKKRDLDSESFPETAGGGGRSGTLVNGGREVVGMRAAPVSATAR